MEEEEEVNPLERDHFLSVLLPSGLEKNATVHGSKPVMDLLVTLCASYHLNPSDYTVEVLSPNKNNISFKPNSPIGSLEAERIVLKPKGAEEKIRRPYMPEATVRLLINYNRAHKAVVRVNPRVPLELLLPAVCDKCEFKVESTVLLRDSLSTEPLDLRKTLNEHGLREVFARDAAEAEQHRPDTPEAATELISPSPPRADKKQTRPKENAGFLSLFRKKKKKAEPDALSSSPPPNQEPTLDVSSSDALPADTPKKRRAPPPPMGASTSVPSNLGMCRVQTLQTSADSTLRRTKRRAPPPPSANSQQEQQEDTPLTGPDDASNPEEERRGSDVSSNLSLSSSSQTGPSPSSSPSPSPSSSHPTFSSCPPSFRGKDFSDARDALAKVLTASVSKGALVNRVRSGSATVPKLRCSSSFSAPRGPDPGAFCSELRAVLKSKFHTEPGWADPLQRKKLTTFKVVPSSKSQEPGPPLEVLGPTQGSLETGPESRAVPGVEEDSSSETGSRSSEPEPGLHDPDQTHVPLAVHSETEAPPETDCNQSEPKPVEDPNSVGSESLANSYEPPEPALDDPDQTRVNSETEAPPEAEYQQSEPEEHPYSPHGSETGSRSSEPEPGLDDQTQVPLATNSETEAPAEAEDQQSEPEEHPYSPQGSETGSRSPVPEPGLDDQTHVTLATNSETEAPAEAEYQQSEPEEHPHSPHGSGSSSCEPEPGLDDQTHFPLPTNSETEAPPKAEYQQSEPEEHLSSPHGSGLSSCEPEPGLDATDQNQVTMETSRCDPEEDSPRGSESEPALLSQHISVEEASDFPPPPCESNEQEPSASPSPPLPPPPPPPEVRGQDEGPMEEAEELNTDTRINTDGESEDLHRPSVSSDQMRSCPRETEEEEEEEEEEDDMFPPPPPPVFFPEDEDLSEPGETTSGPGSGPVTQSESEPRDRAGSAPTRFAQAVALAVQRSRLQGPGKASGPGSPRDPDGARSTYQHGA